MYNNIDYEKYLKDGDWGKRVDSGKRDNPSSANIKPRPASRNQKLPPVQVKKPTVGDLDKYITGGGYLERKMAPSVLEGGGKPGSEIELLLGLAKQNLDQERPSSRIRKSQN